MQTTIKDSRPLPLSISKDDLHLSPRIIHKYALGVDLNKIRSIRSFISHLNSNECAITRPPLHIRGGYTSWSDTLHAIYIYYRILDEDGRKAYNKDSCRKLSQNRQDIYNNNIDYLHKNRLHIDGRETIINENEVVIHPYQNCTNITANDKNDIIDGIPCPYCNFLLTEKVLNSNQYQKIREKNKNVNCLQCLVGVEQGLKQVRKNNLHNLLFQRQVIDHPLHLNVIYVNVHDPNMESYLIDEFGEYVSSLLLPLVNIKTRIKCITVPSYTPADMYNHRTRELSGAQCNLNGLHTHPNVISDSNHFEAVVVLFDKDRSNDASDQNFLVSINDRGYNKELLHKYRQYDEVDIMNGIRATTSSARAGVTQLEDVSKCTNLKCTVDATTFNSCTNSGTCITASYMSKRNNAVKHYAGYRSMPGLYWKGSKMREFAETHSFYRHILIKEAKTFIKSMACLRACGVPPKEESKCLMKKLKRLLNDNIHKLGEKDGLENVLLKYMLGFTEYRSHYTREILSVIDRLGYDTKYAYLYFPLDNVVLEFNMNQSITVTNLSKTVNVDDPSRGSSRGGDGTNISRAVRLIK